MKDFKCVLEVKNSKTNCSNSNCRHFVKDDSNYNCSIVIAEDGPRTLQEIGDYFGLSRMRICQIEKTILGKLKVKLEQD